MKLACNYTSFDWALVNVRHKATTPDVIYPRLVNSNSVESDPVFYGNQTPPVMYTSVVVTI